ncbi:MAG: Predicted rhamnulose-1-phosphate aldolase / Predicted lactaldehyde dehydrogenase [uncultured Thermomicrobiales bacterium]|uniref:Predicted rhamnulose-1-phosphate aldolase / Predicted lactaldehyde dehydrogenase n=1 Tax=uncultured Thermomicrobiales bacterium TaxID=1645740 RepID=A0A6J4UW67_9BACT|nr:MAG: Predicted rhamnulose-1-phosphate aldolase / Predicted lactaldehyde dehydrogenase [uncultured Thermomicrobiales bacterium]
MPDPSSSTLTPAVAAPVAARTVDRWDAGAAAGLDPLAALAYRSNLLGADRAVANFGGGNTSTKTIEPDHTGRPVDVLYVKGSGSDLATIAAGGFTGLRLSEVLPLLGRPAMDDAAMVAYLARCQVDPAMPRASIETLLHAFVPYPCVDHTHPDAVNMLCCAADGEALARACYGDDAIWIPYLRPGFALSKLVAEAVRARPEAKLVLLAKHGLVTWGATPEECYASTVAAINRAADFVNANAGDAAPFGGPAVAPLPAAAREDLLAAVLPALRGAVGTDGDGASAPKILTVDAAEDVLAFVGGAASAALARVGAACPDHLVHTKRLPLWVAFDPAADGADALRERLVEGVARYRAEYAAYHARHNDPNGPEAAPMADPNPRVVLIRGVGLVAVGANVRASQLSRDLAHRAIAVMRGAHALGGYVSLDEAESYGVEYWPLERYKLSLAPPPKELAGRVAFVTGGAGGIGRAVGTALAAAGACVVAADLDGPGALDAVAAHGDAGLGVAMNVTDEAAVAAAYRATVLRYGGVDVVVSNAGLASSAPIEETSLAEWDRNHAVLAKGYFLVAREAFRVLKAQGTGGSVVFVASKNAVVAGKNAAAYSAAKAAELHLARCLAEEGGAAAIRVNTVNPDAVLQGSKIWGSSWRAERAAAYGIEPDELDAFYRARTTLKVNILPADIAEAVLYFASPRSSKSTGNMLNVDGGVAAAYAR